jgi:GT2 family glycosyltransferase
MLLDLLADLHAQEGVELDIHVVESGDDGTVTIAQSRFPALTVHLPGRNAGYAAGNNIAFAKTSGQSPVLVVNPDVRIRDPAMVRQLFCALENEPAAAAAAPIIRNDAGEIEYVGSQVDFRRARVVHSPTHVSEWPSDAPSLDLEWLDGACLLLRRQALEAVGGFDERFFLIVEEVDWCLRARDQGWKLLLVRDCEVAHQRSSSFAGSTKSAYYSARNTYLLFHKHAEGGAWRWQWLARMARLALRRDHLRTGQSWAVVHGAWHALIGRWGPAPADR